MRWGSDPAYAKRGQTPPALDGGFASQPGRGPGPPGNPVRVRGQRDGTAPREPRSIPGLWAHNSGRRVALARAGEVRQGVSGEGVMRRFNRMVVTFAAALALATPTLAFAQRGGHGGGGGH